MKTITFQTFKNELGNSITVNVGQNEDATMILQIIGPDTTFEATLTPNEFKAVAGAMRMALPSINN